MSSDHPLPGWYPPGGFGAAVARESSTSTAETPADTSDTAPARTHRRLPSGEVLCDPLGVPTDEAPRRLGPLEEAWRFIQGQPRSGPGPARDLDHGASERRIRASPGPPDPPDASERRVRAPLRGGDDRRARPRRPRPRRCPPRRRRGRRRGPRRRDRTRPRDARAHAQRRELSQSWERWKRRRRRLRPRRSRRPSPARRLVRL